MLKFDTTQPEGFSGFLQALKASFAKRNQDIRTTGTTKLLHAASEAQGLDNWQQLSATLSKQELPLQEDDNTLEIAKNVSALEDIMSFCEKHAQGEDVNASDILYGEAVRNIEIHFAVSSSTSLSLTIDTDGEVLSGYLRSTGFGRGKEAITNIEDEQLAAVAEAFESKIMATLEWSGISLT
jgi:hypothetical protein